MLLWGTWSDYRLEARGKDLCILPHFKIVDVCSMKERRWLYKQVERVTLYYNKLLLSRNNWKIEGLYRITSRLLCPKFTYDVQYLTKDMKNVIFTFVCRLRVSSIITPVQGYRLRSFSIKLGLKEVLLKYFKNGHRNLLHNFII